jgi:glycosyltransferase involved in cell wall biosynthesis
MKVALVHDWLTGMRGGEKVLEVLCERYPDAELFTLVHVGGSVSPLIERARIHASPLQHLPGIRHYYRQCLPLFPKLIERFDLGGFDLVISSSHCVAKSVIVGPRAIHVCYCHTPMRYAWDQFEAYFGSARLGPVRSAVMRRAMRQFARWDRETAGRVGRYVTNSHYVARRIREYYNREASVVYPPVDTVFFSPSESASTQHETCLIVSALVPYKRIEIAIEACHLAQVPLRIVGGGPERQHLERVAAESGADVTFLGWLTDEGVRDEYRHAALVLLPGEEDFGIVPLEAQACGRPVVALRRGGALESIVPGQTGLLVEESTAAAFADAIRDALGRQFDPETIRRHVERFGRDRFGDEIQTIVDETLSAGRERQW